MAGNIIDSLLGEANTTPGTFLDTFMNATAKPAAITTSAPAPEPEPQPQPQPQKHSGLHDLLGYLKDAALVSAGLRPEFQPKKIAEEEGAALQGFDSDPIAAIHRLVSINPDKARDLYNDMIQNHQREAAMGASEASANAEKARALALKQAADLKTFAAAGAIARTATAKNWDVMRDRVNGFLAARGVEAPIPLPDKYDPAAINAWANGGVDTDKQVDNERQADSLNETHRHNTVAESLQGESVHNQGRNIDSEIADRGADNERADASAADIKEYREKSLLFRGNGLNKRNQNIDSMIKKRQWDMDHPTKGRVFNSLPPPRKAGDVVIGSDGSKHVSKDGKTWDS
jgi:hypothetical protein